MAIFNPTFVPSGKRNARNPYNAKINHVKLSKEQDMASMLRQLE